MVGHFKGKFTPQNRFFLSFVIQTHVIILSGEQNFSIITVVCISGFSPAPGVPALCTLCVSPLFNTPDWDHQLVSRDSMIWTVSHKRDMCRESTAVYDCISSLKPYASRWKYSFSIKIFSSAKAHLWLCNKDYLFHTFKVLRAWKHGHRVTCMLGYRFGPTWDWVINYSHRDSIHPINLEVLEDVGVYPSVSIISLLIKTLITLQTPPAWKITSRGWLRWLVAHYKQKSECIPYINTHFFCLWKRRLVL